MTIPPRAQGMQSRSLVVFILINLLLSACILQPAGDPSDDLAGTMQSLESALSYQATELAAQGTMIAYLATRGPLPSPATRTAPPATVFTADSFEGSVILEEGICCVGATAGETIEIRARFEAESPYAPVTEMRIQASSSPLTADELAILSAWEPYRNSHTFSTTAAINWVGFYVNAQFRDAAGNSSSVYWDDIAIEGNPPAPTP